MNKLSVLMTVYNEEAFIEYAISACYPYIDHLVIVEGAYQETISLGKSPRSTDGTIDIIHEMFSVEVGSGFCLNTPDGKTIEYIQANEQTDKDQRNVGLSAIKKFNSDGWLLIIDGDEVYDKNTINMVKVVAHSMEKQGKFAAIFKSLTFVNDLRHYTEQYFPRLFRITPECKFVNDNYMEWSNANWYTPVVIKVPYIQYHHFAFVKGFERFELKKKWWETRFRESFDYGWHVDKSGKITDEGHKIFEYTGSYPEVIKDHPLYKQIYGE